MSESSEAPSHGGFTLLTGEQIDNLRHVLQTPRGQRWILWLLALGAYFHTLYVPFYLDDFGTIFENQALYDLSNFSAIYGFSPPRWVGYLSLAVNIHLHGFSMPGFHLVNILIHILAGTALHSLVRAMIRTPALAGTLPPVAERWLPFLAAAIFLLHPLHTQAVTYVVQRLASMVAMFYFATLAFYLSGRLADTARTRILFFLAALGTLFLALFTKQNSATIPVALLLLELIFFRPSWKKVTLLLLGFFLAMGLLVYLVVHTHTYHSFSLEALDRLTRENPVIGRQEYFFTQLAALWEYVRLFFLPVGLHLEHDFPLHSGQWDTPVVVLLGSHLLMMGVAVALARRNPLVAFSILFYYLAHQVESGFLPIGDRFFEHRAYLPDLGLALLSAWLLLRYLPVVLTPERFRFVVAMALLVMFLATWQRNNVWRDPVALYQENVELTKKNPRAMAGLARTFLEQKRFQEGLDIMNEIVAASPPDSAGEVRVSGDIVVNLIWALTELGYDQEAMELAYQALGPLHRLRPEDISKVKVNVGNIHFKHKELAHAERAYQEAVAAFPANVPALANLAMMHLENKRFKEALPLLERVMAIQPDYGNVADMVVTLRKVNASAMGP